MVAVALPSSRASWRERLGPRAIILIVIALIHIVLLLLVLFAKVAGRPPEPPPTVVRLIDLPKPAAAPKPKAQAKVQPVTHPNTVKAPKPIVKVPPQKDTPAPLFKTEMMDAVDISKLPSHKGEQSAEGSGGAGNGSDSGTAYGPGAGPGGARLYNAEWYREPSHAELATYLPRTMPEGGGWGEIACKTAEHFAVEDCYELGESPPGSGLSRAARQASWQFKVRPPRIGGQTQIGAWVRIHIEWSMSDHSG
jgi:protein TonB